MRKLTIAVVGCGPCGLATALLLARDGHAVTIFDKFDEPRPVGSGLMLQPTGLAVLAQLGLANGLIEGGAVVRRLFGEAGGCTVLDVHYAALDDQLFGVGIHRASLFDTLLTAVKAAAIPLQTGAAVEEAPLDGSGRRLLFDNGQNLGIFDLVVNATGMHGPLARQPHRALPFGALWANVDWPADSGLQWDVLEQRYWRASKMVGILPIGRPAHATGPQAAFFWSIKAADYDRWRAAPLDEWKGEVSDLWPRLQPILDQVEQHDDLTFARYAHRTLRQPVEPALVHLGDAWHSASPQLGQGANMAMLDAWALALALRAGSDLGEALNRFAAMRRNHVVLYQAITALFTPVYQSDSRVIAMIRDYLIAPISHLSPFARLQARLVAGLFGGPMRPLGLND